MRSSDPVAILRNGEPMMRLYIIRHADPDYPNNTITPEGHLEAKALAKRLSSHGLDRIYVSPLGRALDTMRYTTDSLGMTYEVEDWTQELALKLEDTPYGRLSHWDLPGEVIRSGSPLPTHDSWKEISYYQGTQSPETFERLKVHSDEFLKRQGFERVEGRYRILKHTEDRVAVFCHGGFGLTWLAHLLELPLALVWSGFWMPPSSVTTILFDERSKEWAVPRCIGFGDVSHLYAEGLPVRPRGIITNFN
ncbi:MAG UNVERIFIED_CONTAM: histidine phosphatase family protein [Paenibacillus polymyxa]|jgi:broad specificity phosphatase PhoE|nr:histidine phosphatase family protein [Paenibacillus polymyxa]MBZ6445287.1 histidine phosphatase family protein [Paenibacillus polymyxa]MBZ6452059.1 histidine phosphatase family protein [Paenibacillus polymyxa]MCJ1221949.1 histidine phosphatase family protein [Paenibacillus polymyxa]SEK03828.1 probable phosphoglycerate mutase [Paenibacillus polymyxa]SPY16822.1 phosphoglycerate mutase [Paenibacillus polymyxa]